MLAWSYLAGRSPEQLVKDLIAQHQRFAVCCPYKFSTSLSNVSFILSGRACQDDPGQTKSVDQDVSEEKSDHKYSYVVPKVNYTE